jgi:hypothetical protein
MRVVTFRGVAVKRQRKTEGGILVVYYDRPPEVVSTYEWDEGTRDQYYTDDVRRCEVVRQTPMKVETNGHDRKQAKTPRQSVHARTG